MITPIYGLSRAKLLPGELSERLTESANCSLGSELDEHISNERCRYHHILLEDKVDVSQFTRLFKRMLLIFLYSGITALLARRLYCASSVSLRPYLKANYQCFILVSGREMEQIIFNIECPSIDDKIEFLKLFKSVKENEKSILNIPISVCAQSLFWLHGHTNIRNSYHTIINTEGYHH